MGSGINKVFLLGKITYIEVVHTPGGLVVANLSIETTEEWKDAQKKDKSRTEAHRVIFYNKKAELIKESGQKGHYVHIEGALRTEKYEKDGITKWATKIIGSNIQFLDIKDDYSQLKVTPNNYSTTMDVPF